MPVANRNRQTLEVLEDLETLRHKCERLASALAEIAVLFGACAALVAAVGWWTRQPLFGASAGFALAAAAVLAIGSHVAAKASRGAPRIVAAEAVGPRYPWRRAA